MTLKKQLLTTVLWIILFSSAFMSLPSFAQPQENDLQSIIEFVEDPNGQLTLEDIKRNTSLNFQKWSGSGDINFGFTHSTYWIKFTLTKASNENEHKRLLIPFMTLQHIALFSPNHNTLFAGSNYPPNQQTLPHRYFVFPIHLTEPSQTYYLQVKTNSTMTIPLSLWDIDDFESETQTTYLGLGIYYGGLIALLIYNFFIYLYLKENTFLMYTIFASSMGLSMLFGNGIGQQYLWPHQLFGLWESQYTAGLYTLTLICAIAFSRSFLNIKHSFKKLDQLLYAILLVSFCIFIASFTTSADWVSQSSVFIIMLGTLTLLVTGVLSHASGNKSAKFFILAFGVLSIGTFVSGLRSFDLIVTNFITANSVQVSSAFEMLLLAFALAYRIKIEKDEKEAIQSLLVNNLRNSEEKLEQKVNSRTNELKLSLRNEQDNLEKFIRFGSYISHEFRNPLSIIKSQIGTLQKELSFNITENIDKRLKSIVIASTRMQELFEGWLNTDRLRQGFTFLTITKIHVNDFIEKLTEQCQNLFPERNIHFFDIEQPCYIYADENMMRIAIINLIDNAVKYSPFDKPISLSILSNSNKVAIIVEDQGNGISADNIPNLFQDYFRVDIDNQASGMGLGLGFVNKVCELHNGSIDVVSEIGKGSQFYIWLNKEPIE